MTTRSRAVAVDHPQHAEVERVIALASVGTSPVLSARLVLAALRAALRAGRLTPEAVGAAVGLRAWPVSADDGDFVGPFIGAVLAVAPEDSDG